MQGGIHPDYTGQTYLDILHTVRVATPAMHVHAFSPLEVWQGAATLGVERRDFLRQLRAAGLNTLPGTAAEILHDEVRAVPVSGQTQHRAVVGGDGGSPSAGSADDRDHHVRPHRTAPALGQPPAAEYVSLQQRTGGFHRIRAAAFRAHGGADVSQGQSRGAVRASARRC